LSREEFAGESHGVVQIANGTIALRVPNEVTDICRDNALIGIVDPSTKTSRHTEICTSQPLKGFSQITHGYLPFFAGVFLMGFFDPQAILYTSIGDFWNMFSISPARY
jgi:hypothetical protein